MPPCTHRSRGPRGHRSTHLEEDAGAVSLDECAAGSETAPICPTSLKMWPCMCSGRRASAHPSLYTPIAALHHPWPLLCITPLAQSRVSLHPAPIAFAALSLGATTLCTPSTGPPVQPVLARQQLAGATHYQASGLDGHCIESPNTRRTNIVALLQSGQSRVT
ncbi:Chromosome segregation ATPase [Giardia duodenalis]|uniref:Chromosome segregation ATPase n=1 Tax=Giardia intestinalis TaxID=5741 RepID=V6TZ70_GIAIN|nr:Chromosome segregation ATPase [Giardia intestinalis]